MPGVFSRLLSAVGLGGRPAVTPARTPSQNAWRQRYADLKARYDAAVTNDDNRRHWANADGLSAADANSAGVRDTLRRRSRYEADNNGYYSGIVRTRADDLVGTGPTLQIPLDDDDFASRVEQRFAAWAKAVRLAEKLHTMDQSRLRDGEAFCVLGTNPAVTDAVKLDVFPVEADRVADPAGRFDESPGDGISYDSFGNPVSYTVLREYPDALTRVYGARGPEADTYRAEFVCHWFRRDRPGQLRGVPELVASLPMFAIARRLTLATLTAAETAASFAAMLETQASPDAETVEPTPFETLEIERGMMTTLPAGVKVSQLAAEHPNAVYQDFKWEILAECARPVRMPVNVAAGDTSRSNFSSAKIDHLAYRAGIRVDRTFCESMVLERVFAAWLREAALIPGYLPDGVDAGELPRKWYWPGWVSWDKAEALQDTEMLNNGTTTLAELLAEWGMDWRDVVRQRAKELELMKSLGVTPEDPPARDTAAARLANRLSGHLNGNGVH